MITLPVPLQTGGYDIIIEDSLFANGRFDCLGPHARGRHCLIVTDRNVDGLYSETLVQNLHDLGASRVEKSVMAPGETSKCLQTVTALYNDALSFGMDRGSVVIALGGGVVGDVAGFMAATFMRGIDVVQIPTSLVAQVDSSIGGKTGVDLPQGKNLIGAFHQPKLVVIDTSTLTTLPPRQLRCGLGEVIKYGVILDVGFFEFLESAGEDLLHPTPKLYEQIVKTCCELKAAVVLDDEFDKGGRAILNYGHTFGHALEKLAGYTELTHGEAIAIGMGIAADLAGLIESNDVLQNLKQRQDSLFAAVGLPIRAQGFSVENVHAAIATDKKFTQGNVKLILPTKIGHVELTEGVSDLLIKQAIRGRIESA